MIKLLYILYLTPLFLSDWNLFFYIKLDSFLWLWLFQLKIIQPKLYSLYFLFWLLAFLYFLFSLQSFYIALYIFLSNFLLLSYNSLCFFMTNWAYDFLNENFRRHYKNKPQEHKLSRILGVKIYMKFVFHFLCEWFLTLV